MTNTSSISLVQPHILEENKMTIHEYLRQSYTEVSQQVQDGLSFLKEEFRDMYKQVGACVTNMISPVNNFLKDPTQIEADFLQEAAELPGMPLSSNIVPIEIALQSPMEENY